MTDPEIVFTGKLDEIKEVGLLLDDAGILAVALNPSGSSSS